MRFNGDGPIRVRAGRQPKYERSHDPKQWFRYSSSSSGTVSLSRSDCGPGHGFFVSAKRDWVIPHTMHFDPSKGQLWPPAR
jgi:hypothetical protein